jgi:hypothetical protein
MSGPAPPLQATKLVVLFAVVAASVFIAGFPVPRAGVAAAATPVEVCAKSAVGSVGDDVKSAACAELESDLIGIGNLLDLPILFPTGLPTSPVKLIFSAVPGPPDVYMETHYLTIGNTLHEPCEITVYPLIFGGTPPTANLSDAFRLLMAHEVVHCYQNSVISYEENGGDGPLTVPQWISEGSATYIATLYKHAPEPATPSFWVPYGWLGIPNKELLRRSYDAVGWYSMVARATGNDLTKELAPAWLAWVSGGEDAFITALGGDDPAVEAAWAPSLLHAPQWGDAWDTPGIGVPPGAKPATVDDTIAAEDVPFSVQIAPYAAIVDKETTVADGLVEVGLDNGLASVHDLGTTDVLDFSDQLFCIGTACDDTGLTCPGSPKKVKPIPLTVPFYVAAGGSTKLGTLTLENISAPTTASTPMQLPKAAGPCTFPGTLPLPKAASSQGDPHLQTLSGGTFDFQGAGEYTLVRSTSGDVDVQVRQTPYENSKQVAFSTALAMRVGTTKVEVNNGNQIRLQIGNKVVVPAALVKKKLLGGGDLTYSGARKGEANVVASWPDGSSLDVFTDTVGMNITFTPPSPGVDTFSGLLAALVAPQPGESKTALKSETLIGGNGHRYRIDPTTSAGFKTLYGPFAESWRVTPKNSLFTYPKGKSTSSYDVKGFPATVADLPPAKESRARATCKADGVTDPKLLADCALDVGETGHAALATAFTQSYDKGASSTPPATATTTTTFPAASDGSVHPAKYYFAHPCQVVTTAELTQALGREVPPLTSFPPECEFIVGEDQVTFTSDPAGQYKSQYGGNGVVNPEPSLGPAGYCIEQPSPFPSVAVASLGSAGSFQLLADNCTQAVALAKDALTHISGL